MKRVRFRKQSLVDPRGTNENASATPRSAIPASAGCPGRPETAIGRLRSLFPRRSDRRKPISENTLLFALYRMGYRQRATTHGFRALASTILDESGLWRPDAIERQLAHKEQNAVRAAYHRSEYSDERVRMMQWWADYLDGEEAHQVERPEG